MKIIKSVNRNLKIVLRNLRYNLFKDFLYTYHNADFINDKRFIESYRPRKLTDKSNTLLKDNDIRWRMHVLTWAASHAAQLSGDFVDCGVNTGIFARSIIIYINFNKMNKKYYLLDTFKGLYPKYSSEKELNRGNIKIYMETQGLY